MLTSDLVKFQAQLIRDESCILHAYQDTKGWWTIGVGHLIDHRKGGSIPMKIAMDLLEGDIEHALVSLIARYPWVVSLSPPRQAALANMAFNMGIEGVATFVNTMDAARRGDWATVEIGIRESKYHNDVGDRAVRVSKQLLTGEWV